MTIAKDKWMKYKGTSGRAVLTLCGVYGVAYLFSLQPVNRIYYSVLNVLLAVGIYSMLQQTEQNLRKIEEKRDRKRRICYVAVISFLFALSMVMGYQLQNLGMTDCGMEVRQGMPSSTAFRRIFTLSSQGRRPLEEVERI